VFLGERLPAGFVISAVLVLAGVWITRVGGERVSEAEPAEAAPSS
jgi:hypothetical protein